MSFRRSEETPQQKPLHYITGFRFDVYEEKKPLVPYGVFLISGDRSYNYKGNGTG